jgi:hypothetical protein
MEFLMALQPPGCRIEDGALLCRQKHDAQLISFCAEFAHQFLCRVPSFVWKNLQITPPAFRRMR